jgi:hypothetical protein
VHRMGWCALPYEVAPAIVLLCSTGASCVIGWRLGIEGNLGSPDSHVGHFATGIARASSGGERNAGVSQLTTRTISFYLRTIRLTLGQQTPRGPSSVRPFSKIHTDTPTAPVPLSTRACGVALVITASMSVSCW